MTTKPLIDLPPLPDVRFGEGRCRRYLFDRPYCQDPRAAAAQESDADRVSPKAGPPELWARLERH